MNPSVRNVMRTKVATCGPNATILDACNVLKEFATSTVIVVDADQHVLGVFSERDLVNKVVCANIDVSNSVSSVMTSPVITADVNQNDIQVINLIIEKHVKKIPVVENEKLVGVVAESDLLKYLADATLDIVNS